MRRLMPLALVPALLLALGLASAIDAVAQPLARVPHVVGSDVDDAVHRLAGAGFEPVIQWTADGEPGLVLRQNPGPNARLARGSTVELVVGLRVRVDTIVPDVIGMMDSEAVAGLEMVYTIEVQDVPGRSDQDGRVVAQDPAPGARVPFRGVVHLSIGRAGLRTEVGLVPNAVGLDLAEAESLLLEQGLIPVPRFQRAQGQPFQVVRQSPAPGLQVPPETRVELLVVAPRGGGRRARLPSLYGLAPQEARQVLQALGLRAREERMPSKYARDTVVRQTPATGALVHVGSVVRLVVAFPAGRTHIPARVLVPDVRGARLAGAWELARVAGVRLDIRRRIAPEHAIDQVIEQRPTPGVRVPLGAVVRIDLPVVTEVPDLLRLRTAEAAARAQASQLAIVFEGDAQQGGPRGARVVDQTPAAGVLVAAGSTVRAVLRRAHGGNRGVVVPEVRNLQVRDARQALQDAGLEGQFSGPAAFFSGSGVVISQEPLPGARVPRGSVVRLTYRIPTPPGAGLVRVPDLKGLTEEAAEQALARRGLVGRMSVIRGRGPKGITGQRPDPGTLARAGTEVRYTVRR